MTIGERRSEIAFPGATPGHESGGRACLRCGTAAGKSAKRRAPRRPRTGGVGRAGGPAKAAHAPRSRAARAGHRPEGRGDDRQAGNPRRRDAEPARSSRFPWRCRDPPAGRAKAPPTPTRKDGAASRAGRGTAARRRAQQRRERSARSRPIRSAVRAVADGARTGSGSGATASTPSTSRVRTLTLTARAYASRFNRISASCSSIHTPGSRRSTISRRLEARS